MNRKVLEYWDREDPKAVIGRILAEIPDTPRIINNRSFFSRLFSRIRERQSSLESYFLYKVGKADPSALPVSDGRASGDSFDAAAGIVKCLRDGVRTKRFAEAIRAAVTGIEREMWGTEEIRVVDAGAGAIPIMAIAAAFASTRVHCVCL